MIACQTIFRSLAKLVKKKIGCSIEINNFKKSCSECVKMMILTIVYLQIINNFVVLTWSDDIRNNTNFIKSYE